MNTAQLKKVYAETITPALQKQFGYSSSMQVPVLKKIVINQGLGDATQDKKIIDIAINEISSITGQKAVATYKSYALGRIASKKTYPYAARSNGLEGKVRARAVINPDGTLADAVILTPCEYELLNTACLAAIKKAAPFKKMSAGMGVLTVSFVMDFSLH